MKKVLFVLSALLLAYASAEAKGGEKGDPNVVSLRMIDPSLEKHEKTNLDAFVIDSNRVGFDQPGMDKYDAFFKEVAIVTGTIIELRYILDQIDAKAIGVLDAKDILEVGKRVLQQLKERVPKLLEEAQSLKPSDDFTGFKKTKIPGVTAGLGKATATLTRSGDEVISIAERLASILEPAKEESKE